MRYPLFSFSFASSFSVFSRRSVRARGHFPNEQAALKVLYLVATKRQANRENLTGRISGWKKILNTLSTIYGDRITEAID